MKKVSFIFISFFLHSLTSSQTQFWQHTNGPGAGSIRSIQTTGGGNILAGSMWDGLHRTTDGGGLWTPIGLSGRQISCIAPRSSQDVFVGTDTSGVQRSTDGGLTWHLVHQAWEVSGIAFKGADTIFVTALPLALGAGLWRSINDGATWEYLGDPHLTNVLLNTILVTTNGVLFVGTSGYGIMRSSDNGVSWLGSSAGLTNAYVYSLIQARGGHILAGTGEGVFVSTNAGALWQHAALTGFHVYAFAENAAGALFAGTAGQGVYISTDSGSSWIQRNEGLHNPEIYGLVVDDDGYLYAATSSDSVYRSIQPTTAIDNPLTKFPLHFSLSPNYPNPFNPTTSIEFRVPSLEFVSLKVYDVLGREVATLVNDVKHAGEYQVTWDAGEQASGVYFYRLQAGAFVETKKMVVMK